MHKLWHGIQRVVTDALSLDQMNKKYHVLILNYIFFMLYTTLEGVFVNTLLYTISKDISIVILYRGITFVASAVAMHPAAFLGQKKSPLFIVRMGGAIYLLMYLVLFFGMDSMNLLLVPTAILSGSGGAFYWVGHNVLVTNYTNKNNREIGIAILGIVQGVMTLLIPVVSGFVISWMAGNSGYRVMFGIGMAGVVAQVLIQMKLYPVEQAQHTSQMRLAVKMIARKASVKLMLGYEAVRGFRDGAFGFIMNMILFEIITDESLVGINTFVSGAASIIGSWVYGRVVRSGNRDKATIGMAVLLSVLALPLFWALNVPSVMIYNVATSFGSLFLFYSCNNQSYDVLGQNLTTRKCMAELLAFREGACCVGRMCGLGVLMLLPHTGVGYVQSILVLTAAQVFCGLMIRQARKMVDRKQGLTYEPGFEPAPDKTR